MWSAFAKTGYVVSSFDKELRWILSRIHLPFENQRRGVSDQASENFDSLNFRNKDKDLSKPNSLINEPI